MTDLELAQHEADGLHVFDADRRAFTWAYFRPAGVRLRGLPLVPQGLPG